MKYFLLPILLLVAGRILAQAPGAFNYQGAARNDLGEAIADQPIMVRAAILGNDAETILYSEEHSVSTNQFGLFTLRIGEGTPLSDPFSAIDWSSGNYFLQIELSIDGGPFKVLGATQLLSVPYALYANQAGESQDSKWSENSLALFYEGSKRVGIRTDEPTVGMQMDDLGVDGLGRFRLLSSQGNTNLGIDFGIGSDKRWVVSARGDNYQFYPRRFIIDYNNGFGWLDAALAIDDIGRVGISEVSPKARLHVSSGDIYLDDPGRGVIMRSQNGNCWRLTVSNEGQPVFTAMPCPQ